MAVKSCSQHSLNGIMGWAALKHPLGKTDMILKQKILILQLIPYLILVTLMITMLSIILQLILYLINTVTFDCLCRCALSDEGASRLTDVHDNSEEVNVLFDPSV